MYFCMLCAIERIVSSFSAFSFHSYLIFGNYVHSGVNQSVLRLDLLFFCSRFFLLEFENLLSFSILNHWQVRKFLLLGFLCIDFLLDKFYTLMLSILYLIHRLIFYRFCNVSVGLLDKWMSLFSNRVLDFWVVKNYHFVIIFLIFTYIFTLIPSPQFLKLLNKKTAPISK